ncbi:MAG TPA: hypothetical protein VG964_00215 [Candidatus Saccharimonadales bacterium]|nr:hypothetical protein [Candidatus Saccharimonadales bacterium]
MTHHEEETEHSVEFSEAFDELMSRQEGENRALARKHLEEGVAFCLKFQGEPDADVWLADHADDPEVQEIIASLQTSMAETAHDIGGVVLPPLSELNGWSDDETPHRPPFWED